MRVSATDPHEQIATPKTTFEVNKHQHTICKSLGTAIVIVNHRKALALILGWADAECEGLMENLKLENFPP